jgi:uncharacterized protein
MMQFGIKRLILVIGTIAVLYLFGISLISSWQQPQVQSQLDLYETNLVLQASEWQAAASDNNFQTATFKPILGRAPFKSALTAYQKSQRETQQSLQKLQTRITQLPELSAGVDPEQADDRAQRLQKAAQSLQSTTNQLALQLGILQAHQNQVDGALKTWSTLANQTAPVSIESTANVLVGLWSDPPQILPDAEAELQTKLTGWFRYQALTQLYQLQQRPDALATLQTTMQLIAQRSLTTLTLLIIGPAVGFVTGSIALIVVIGQRLLKGRKAWLAQNATVGWTTPWDGEIIWQVMLLFVFCQFLIPFGLQQVLGLKANPDSQRSIALISLFNYLMFSLGSLLAVYASIKPTLPLPEGWFPIRRGRFEWVGWGLGGYLVAIPVVLIVSLVNQWIWRGQGGSNDILPIALSGQDPVALICFYVTAAVMAPLFEEFLFRGFLLSSLTRYLPVNGAVVLSGAIFALVHLKLSEVLPLMTLGIILGVVYTRSRNLLAPMLLHCLWNSGTLITLFILGSSRTIN